MFRSNQAICGLVLIFFLNTGCTTRNHLASPIREPIGSDDYRYYMLSQEMSASIKRGVIVFTEADASECKKIDLTPTQAFSLYSAPLPNWQLKRSHNCRMITSCAEEYEEHGFSLNTSEIFQNLSFSAPAYYTLCSETAISELAEKRQDERFRLEKKASEIEKIASNVKIAQGILDRKQVKDPSFYYNAYVKAMTSLSTKGSFETTSEYTKRVNLSITNRVGYGPHVVKTNYIAVYDADLQGWGFESVNDVLPIGSSNTGPCAEELPVDSKIDYLREKKFIDAWGNKIPGLEAHYSRILLSSLSDFSSSERCKHDKLYMPIDDARKMGEKPIAVYLFFNILNDGEFSTKTSYYEPTRTAPVESTTESFFIPGQDVVILFVRDGKILRSFSR